MRVMLMSVIRAHARAEERVLAESMTAPVLVQQGVKEPSVRLTLTVATQILASMVEHALMASTAALALALAASLATVARKLLVVALQIHIRVVELAWMVSTATCTVVILALLGVVAGQQLTAAALTPLLERRSSR